MKNIYLDNGSTTPVRKIVLKKALPYFLKIYGNPSSFHSTGLIAKKEMQKARENISKILNCDPSEIIFTGSGTESINLAIKGIAFKELLKSKKGHFITQKTEHDAVIETFKWLEKLGFEVSYINVDENGIVKLDELKNAIRDNTLLVSIMYANNEIGTIQPIKEIAKIVHSKNKLLHTDACQGAEYLSLNTKELDIDMLTINGSKIYSFKGSGLLFKKKEIQLEALIHGGHQEKDLRSGTENIPAIIAMNAALEIATKEKKSENKRLIKLRDYMIKEIEKKIIKVKINGDRKSRLPNNVNVSFYGIEGESILLHLNERGIRASTGSACSSQNLEPSHVLIATGTSHELAHGSIRFTLGKYTTKKEIDYTIKQLEKIIPFLRKLSSAWNQKEGQ